MAGSRPRANMPGYQRRLDKNNRTYWAPVAAPSLPDPAIVRQVPDLDQSLRRRSRRDDAPRRPQRPTVEGPGAPHGGQPDVDRGVPRGAARTRGEGNPRPGPRPTPAPRNRDPRPTRRDPGRHPGVDGYPATTPAPETEPIPAWDPSLFPDTAGTADPHPGEHNYPPPVEGELAWSNCPVAATPEPEWEPGDVEDWHQPEYQPPPPRGARRSAPTGGRRRGRVVWRKRKKVGPFLFYLTNHGLSTISVKIGPVTKTLWSKTGKRTSVNLPGNFSWRK